MASFRGISASQITQSLQDLFAYLDEKNVGPLTKGALAQWRAEGGLLDKIEAAPDAAAIEKILRDEGQGHDQNAHLVFWLNTYYGSLLPQLMIKADRDGDTAAVERVKQVTADVARWGGFFMLGMRLHVMGPEDHEIQRYVLDVLKLDMSDTLSKFNPAYFKGPFESYSAVYSGRIDFNRAAAALNDLAKELGMADHVSVIAGTNERIDLQITAKLATAFARHAGGLDLDVAPVGLTQGTRFIPVVPVPRP